MSDALLALLRSLLSGFRSRRLLLLENLALRHQPAVLRRQIRKPRLCHGDRRLWLALRRLWPDWQRSLVLFQPQTSIAWHRLGFRLFWRWKSRACGGRPCVDRDVTDSPSASWTAQQLNEAFPYSCPPHYLLRDRDRIYGLEFVRRAIGLGMHEKVIAPRSPWENPFVERLIGSIRRECLDHVIVLNKEHLRRRLTDYLSYYHRHRTHRSLQQDSAPPPPVAARIEKYAFND